ncbi:uncharacterized protein LOC142176166 [Nicotiana tabacum]|uniref:Uncharacterized protein LOC142176166 n=1 Tax=Nicotiana tabacum TaxID=4097 RepID=A0AC58TQ54_TOBAC
MQAVVETACMHWQAVRIQRLVEILSQHGKVIAYALRQLKAHEKNYLTHDLELAAVVFALKIWSHYTYGGKANVVADALSQRSMGSLAHIEVDKRTMMKEVHRLANLGVRLLDSEDGGILKEGIHKHKTTTFEQGGDDGTLRYRGRLCIPDVDGLRERIMSKAYNSRYSIYPGSIKMYHDLKEKGLGTRVNLSTTFHPQIDGQAKHTIQTLKDMLRVCVIDFKGNWDDHLPLIEFAYSNSYHSSIKMAHCEALYGQRCRLPIGWFEVGEAELLGPDLVYHAMEKVNLIQRHLKMAQSRQKSYSDVRRRDLEFQVNDWMFLKVSPMKGVMRFGKKGKLSPRYIGPFRILRRIRQVAYELELPQELVVVHPVFHVSMLKKFMGDPSFMVPTEIIGVEEATWEAKEDMKSRYPHLFEEQKENVEGN